MEPRRVTCNLWPLKIKNMKTEDKKKKVFSGLLAVTLSLSALMGALAIVVRNNPNLVETSFAQGGEEDGDSEGDSEGDSGGGSGSSNESAKKTAEKAQETAKKKVELERETAKKAAERSKDTSTDSGSIRNRNRGLVKSEDASDPSFDLKNGDDNAAENNDGEAADTASGNRGRGDNGMFRDQGKTVSKLQEKIAEAEKEILEKQAEGVDVTAALARLAEAKAKVGTVADAFAGNDLEAAKTLSQEVSKLTHFAKENDLHGAKEVAEKVSKVTKRIGQVSEKIALLESAGGDGSQFKKSLSGYEADVAGLRTAIAAGNFDAGAMSSSLEGLERKVKVVKNAVEGALFALGGTDSQYDDDFKMESEDVASQLQDVADIEGDSVGRVIHGIAEDHKNSAAKIGQVVQNVDQRNPALQILLGSNDSDLSSLEQEIAANKTRTEMLTRAADTVGDQDMKSILLAQVATLKAQGANLETFVSGQRDRLSVFGWFFHLF